MDDKINVIHGFQNENLRRLIKAFLNQSPYLGGGGVKGGVLGKKGSGKLRGRGSGG